MLKPRGVGGEFSGARPMFSLHCMLLVTEAGFLLFPSKQAPIFYSNFT